MFLYSVGLISNLNKMKNKYLSSSLLATIMLLNLNIAYAQQLASSWTVDISGEHPVTKHIAVIPATGHRYVLTKLFDDGHNFVHLDQNGSEVWSVLDRGRFKPTSIVYNRGKIFLLGVLAETGSATVRAGLRMYEDTGSGPRLVWPEHEVYVEDRYTTGEMIIEDPSGDGVIFTCMSRSPDLAVNVLKTQRISASREVVTYDDVSLGAAAVGAFPQVDAMYADGAGNVYVTGLSDPVSRRTEDGYINPSTQFIVKFNAAGRRQWMTPIREDGFSQYGFDIEGDGTHVYVLGQRVREHSNVPTPAITGETTLTKLNPVDGRVIRTISLPSRLREPPTYLSSRRKSLLIDRPTSTLFVGYDGTEPSAVTLKAFNTSLDEQWTRNVRLVTSAYFASLISPGEGRLAIGVNNRIRAATRLVITSFTRAGAQFDRYESPLGGILELHPDASGQIHLGGLKDVPVKYVGYFEQVLRYHPRFWILPHDFLPAPSLIGELKSQGRLKHWGSLGTMWNCPSLPCNAAFTASLSSANGASWKETFTKPTTISLPPDNTFNIFKLSAKEKSADRLLFEVDRTLIDNGISSLKLEGDWAYGTLTVSSLTDGSNIPLTLSLIGKNGNVVSELKTIAPGTQVFSGRVAAPVSYIRIKAPQIAPAVSVFPNPSPGKFKVTLEPTTSLPVQLTIHDGQGAKVHEQLLNSYDTEIALSKPLPGFYVLRIKNDNVNVTKTLQVK